METSVTPEIDAEITLLSSGKGGRQQAISGDYRGVLSLSERESFSMRFVVPQDTEFRPGQTLTVGVQFLYPQAALPRFPIGSKFKVWEGGVIGHGRVVAIRAVPLK